MRRVLIMDSETLLGASVQSYLAREADLEVIGISAGDQSLLAEQIERWRPDVVILGDPGHQLEPTHLLAQFRGCSRLRVVVLSADDNQVHIYCQQKVLMTCAADLLHIIRSG